MQTAEIRRRFLEHSAERGHTVVPSASLVSPDPSLLFTAAGMVPCIPQLTGREPAPYPRATSVQKCVRTLDIEEVGKTTRHGTFFQMNGNFSFGDYFKEGAIQHAWDLVTGSQADGKLGFGPERIWVAVYSGDGEAADAGMGLERVAYLLQGVNNLYEIDEAAPVLYRGAELAGVTYGKSHEDDVQLRVVADHVRSGLMLIGDGVTPGNEGRGYILRRLLRRAISSMKRLGVDEATLPELLPVSRDAMSPSYPELATDFDRISAVAYAEEEAFRRTLSQGTTLFDTAVRQA